MYIPRLILIFQLYIPQLKSLMSPMQNDIYHLRLQDTYELILYTLVFKQLNCGKLLDSAAKQVR